MRRTAAPAKTWSGLYFWYIACKALAPYNFYTETSFIYFYNLYIVYKA